MAVSCCSLKPSESHDRRKQVVSPWEEADHRLVEVMAVVEGAAGKAVDGVDAVRRKTKKEMASVTKAI